MRGHEGRPPALRHDLRIYSRYIDGNGYSLRVGEDDLASTYRVVWCGRRARTC